VYRANPATRPPFAWIDDEDEPAPVRVRRQPLPSTFEGLSFELLVVVRALTRLTADDRFPRHRHAVVRRNIPVLNRAAAELRDLRDDLLDDSDGWSS